MRTAVDLTCVESDWHARGFSCQVWTDPPGQVWADFVHDVDELVVTIEGEVEFEFNDQAFRPKPGEELMIPTGARHTVRNVGTTSSRWLFGYRIANSAAT